jgi:cytochrome c-type biogenesis protein CcsB
MEPAMENLCYNLNLILPVLYSGTMLAYLLLFITNRARFNKTSRTLIVISALVHGIYLILRGIGQNHIPLASQGEALTFFAFATIAVYLYLELRLKNNAMGIFVVVFVFGFQLLATFRYSDFAPMRPILQSGWFAFHTASSVLSFAAFAIAALLSILYLLLFREIRSRKPGFIFHRIPPLEFLDEMAYKSVTLGFLLLTIGIGTGVIWADQAWGKFWSWDPKQVSSLVVWLVYAAYLHARLQRGWAGKRVAIFATLGFCTLIFTFVFVDVLFNTAHRFL